MSFNKLKTIVIQTKEGTHQEIKSKKCVIPPTSEGQKNKNIKTK